MFDQAEHAFTQMLMLLIITAVGYACTRLGYLDFRTKDKLTKLLMNVALPCMIVASAAGVDATQIGSQAMLAFVLGVLQFFLLLACGYAFAAAFRTTGAQRGTYIIMSTCTNTSFVGIPVAAAIFGDDVTIFCSVFIMAMSLLFFSMGVPLAAGAGGTAAQTPRERVVAGLRAATSPMTFAALLALVLAATGVQLPGAVQGSIELIGNITAPLAMLIVGVIVSSMRPREFLGELRLYPFILIRQVIVPLAVYFALSVVVDNAMILGMFTVMFAMPTGSMASMFAAASGCDERLAARGTVLSTLASFPIVPVLVALIAVV